MQSLGQSRFLKGFKALVPGLTVLLIVLQASPAAAYNASGTLTGTAPSRSLIEIDQRLYRISSQTQVAFDASSGYLATSVTDLRLGEYVQLETQGDLVLKIRRYRKGPPH